MLRCVAVCVAVCVRACVWLCVCVCVCVCVCTPRALLVGVALSDRQSVGRELADGTVFAAAHQVTSCQVLVPD